MGFCGTEVTRLHALHVFRTRRRHVQIPHAPFTFAPGPRTTAWN